MRVRHVEALGDNLMYLIYDDETTCVAAVDPVEPEKLSRAIEPGYKLVAAFTTHHHCDHSGGNEKLSKMYPGLPFYGGDQKRIPAQTVNVKHDDVIKIGNLIVQCLFTPCHTTSHMCYYLPTDNKGCAPAVFTGDTLFIGGCGRFFEGNAQQMNHALNVVLASLPDETRVYCGHEYSIQNLSFGKSVDPNNQRLLEKLRWAHQMRAANKVTIPSTIADEKLTNPFMRVMHPDIRSRFNCKDDVTCMKLIRETKDHFKG